MKKLLITLLAAAFVLTSPVLAGKEEKAAKKEAEAAEKRAEIDAVVQESLDEVFANSEGSKALYDSAYGYAVFDNLRVTFIFTGGGGHGVAVNKSSGKRTYMTMGTGGLALGIGAQKYQVIFFFESEEVFTNFIEKGWKAETGAGASAGDKGANVATGFISGIATYQITEAGLMASADISGTKYGIDKDLN